MKGALGSKRNGKENQETRAVKLRKIRDGNKPDEVEL